MKEFYVRMGGKDRLLFYDTAARRAIETAFAFNGQPAKMLDLIQNHFRPDQPGSFEVQATILWAGIRQSKKGLTVEETGIWITKELTGSKDTPPRHIAELIVPALKAIGVSGCLGFTFELPEEEPEEEPDEKGKAPPPAAEEPAKE